ncbi:MAG: phosphatase PAP2 family protein [Candidatus Longimicrobiales bacterium M2_2A_002]
MPALALLLALAVPAPVAQPHGDTAPVLADIELGARLVGHAVAAPLRWTARDWLAIPASALVLAGVSTVDESVEAMAESSQGAFGDAYFGALEPLGAYAGVGLMAGAWVGGLVLDRPAWRRGAVEAAAATVVAGGIITSTLKAAVGRARPDREVGAYEFDAFSGQYSFPSYHTAQAFVLATVVAGHSRSTVVDAVAYATAASVGAARIYHDVHFLTDVLAGAALGTVVARAVVRRGHELTGVAEPWVGVVGGRTAVGVRVALR